MEYTTNYQLRKPIIGVDLADIKDENRNMDTIDEIMHSSQVSLAEAYDNTKTYNTNDVVMYEFLMYKCLEDGVTGTWNATKWERTTASAHGAGGGSDVEITPTLSTGTKIADYEIDGVQGELYAPTGGGEDGVYIEETLWEDSQSTSAWASPIELSINIDNYDFILIQLFSQAEQMVSVRQIPVGDNSGDDSLSVGALRDGQSPKTVWLNKNTNVLRVFTATGTSITLTKIVGIKMSGNYFTPQIYSTEEREVGVWINGKPLYQKTYSLTTPITVTGGGTWVSTGIDISDVDYLVDAEFCSFNAKWDAINAVNDSGVLKAVLLPSGSLTVNEITILYTKTTDVAGSGSWTPSGVPAHHYSTDEQVVGTWIDGSTVYEKTEVIDLTSSPLDGAAESTVQLSAFNSADLITDIKVIGKYKSDKTDPDDYYNVVIQYTGGIKTVIDSGRELISYGNDELTIYMGNNYRNRGASADNRICMLYVTMQYTKTI